MKKKPFIFSGYDWQHKKINEYKKSSTEGVGNDIYSLLKFQYYARATYFDVPIVFEVVIDLISF